MNQFVELGTWSEIISWKLYLSDKTPPAELCTAVFCVAIHDDKIILARSERGWGMIGGHIEHGENLTDALERESVEEGGFIPSEPIVFAYREITAARPLPNPAKGKYYPFPISYVVYYFSETDRAISEPTEEEIVESGSFSIDEIQTMGTPDRSTIRYGWDAFCRSKGRQ